MLRFGAGSILTLQNVQLSDLSGSDFIFNQAPTSLALGNTVVSENQVGAVIGSVPVTDPDGGTTFTFAVSDPRFVVTGEPGAYLLKLKAGISLDYEAQSVIHLTVTATDEGGLSVSKDFDVSVTDIEGFTITGTAGRDIIDGRHTVSGQSFATTENDIINAGDGNDIVYGLDGNDKIRGGAGDDILFGDAGDDRITGGAGNDRMYGGTGDDVFVIAGSDAQSDIIVGGDGTDSIEVSGTGDVTLSHFSALQSSVEVWTGNGAGVVGTAAGDYLDFSGLQSSTGLAYIDGGAGNDRIIGSGAADDLRGGDGNDLLYGNDGDDRLTGGAGTDLMIGGSGDDTFVIAGTEAIGDVMRGDDGTDSIEVSGTDAVTLARFDAGPASIEEWHGNGAGVVGTAAGDYLDFSDLTHVSNLGPVDGGAGNDWLIGSYAADDLRGGDGNDIIYGMDGNDRITGGAGVDTLDGGAGNDTFVIQDADAVGDVIRGGDGTDTIEVAGTGPVTLSRFDAAASSIEAWHGNDAGVVGTRAADVLDFSALLENTRLGTVDGGDGNDRLIGSAFADDLRGGNGNDTLIGGAGDDMLSGGSGSDHFIFASGFGHDTIVDFDPSAQGGDIITFSKTVFVNLDDMLAVSHQIGSDVVIEASPNDTLTLHNVELTALHPHNFTFE